MPTRVHLIGVCGTAMATLAAMLKRNGLRRARLRSGRLSADERFPRSARAFRRSAGYRAEHITSDLDLVVVGNAISRGNPELEEVLDRKIRYCSLPEAIREHFLWGARSIVDRRHARQDDDDVAGRMAADAAAASIRACSSAASRATSASTASSYRIGQGRDFVIEGDEYDSAFFDKTAKFLKYLPDIAVDQQHRVRSRGHLRRPRRGHAGLPAAGQPRAAPRPAARRRRQPAARGRWWPRRRLARRDLRPRRRRRLAGARSRGRGRADAVRRAARAARRSAAFEVPLVGAHNVRNALAAIAVATEVGVGAESDRRGAAPVRRRQAAPRGGRRGRRRDRVRRLRPSSDGRRPRRSRACARRIPAARIWAVFEPRSASSCRRVFQDDFARAFAGADEVIVAPVFRSTLPEAERLSVPQLVRDLQRRGASRRARPNRSTTSSARSCGEHRAGRSGRDDVERRLRRHPRQAAAGRWRRERRSAIVAAGDSALIVEFEERIDPAINARAIALAECAAGGRDGRRARRRADLPIGRRVLRSAAHELRRAARARSSARPAQPPPAASAARDAAPDSGLLRRRRSDRISPRWRASPGSARTRSIALHAAATYRVFMLGFVPGFAYMGVVDERIAAPRHATPRVRVPPDRSGSPACRPASIPRRRRAAGSSSAGRR